LPAETKMYKYGKSLGQLIKDKRRAADLTLIELSACSGVSPSYLGRIENAQRFPSAAVLQRIAGPLGFDEDDLFTRAGYLSPHPPHLENNKPISKNKLDPYVAKVLSQEPVEVQRATVSILTLLKSVASGLNTLKSDAGEHHTKKS
jgi:transcriptional regulator with XRE-family HTH domain